MDEDYKVFSFPLPDSTKNFVKIVESFCSKQNLIAVPYNRDKPMGTDGRTDLFYEKYLLISDPTSMPYSRYSKMEIDFFEYEFEDLASELHFINSPKDLMVIQIMMSPNEGDRLYSELNKDLFELVNPIDHATSILVNLAAIGNGAELLQRLFRHLFKKYDGLEEIIKPQIERDISQSEIFKQAIEQMYSAKEKQLPANALPSPENDDFEPGMEVARLAIHNIISIGVFASWFDQTFGGYKTCKYEFATSESDSAARIIIHTQSRNPATIILGGFIPTSGINLTHSGSRLIASFRIIKSEGRDLLGNLLNAAFNKWPDSKVIVGHEMIRNYKKKESKKETPEKHQESKVIGTPWPRQSVSSSSPQESLPAPEYNNQGMITLATLKQYFQDASKEILEQLQLTQKLWDVDRLTFAEIEERADISRSTFQRRKKMLKEKGLLRR